MPARIVTIFVKIGQFAIMIGKVIIKILELLPKMIEMAISLLDPVAFIKDLIFGLFAGLEMLFKGIIDILLGKARAKINALPLINQKSKRKGSCTSNEKKCIKPKLYNYLIMIICPPFAVFMKYGILRGWFWVLICGLLTYYGYYFPGLIFAALHIIC